MNCQKCNAVIPDDSKFCIECGAPAPVAIDNKCPACGCNNLSDASVCAVCGTAMTAVSGSDDPTEADLVQSASDVVHPQNTIDEKEQTEMLSDADASAQLNADTQAPAKKEKKEKKKRSKKSICITLSIIGVIAIIAVIIGVFFRGLFLNLILGNKKYAAYIETKGVLTAIDTVNPDDDNSHPGMTTDDFNKIASKAVGDIVKTYNSFSSTEEGEFSGFNFGSMINLYHEKMTEAFDSNGAKLSYDLDMELTDAAKSALGISDETGESIDKILKAISDMSFSMECAADTEKMQVYLALSNAGDFNADVKVIAQEDGTLFFTLPFATEKGLMIKLETGEQLDDLEIAVELENIKTISIDLAKIYLNYFSNSEVTIEKGRMEAAGVSTEGRHIIADLNKEKIGEMVAEMLNYISESEYLTNSVLDIMNYCGADYTKEKYKEALADAAQTAKESANVSIRSETIVDYNSNILAKSYTVTVDEKTYGAGFVNSEEEIGAAIFDGKKDLISALILKTSSSTGKIHFKVNTGFGALIGMNVEFTDAKIVDFGSSQVVVGDFHVYLAGTKDSEEKGSAVKVGMKFTLEDNTYKGSMYLNAAQYGNIAINGSVTPCDVAIDDIPEDALDITGIAEWTFANKEEIQYLLDLIADLQNATELDAEEILELLVDPLTDIVVDYLQSLLGENVPVEQVAELAELLFGAMNNVESAFDIASLLCSDDLITQVEDLYNSMSECYEEISNEVEMLQDEYEEYAEIVDGYIEDAQEICTQLGEISENGADAILPEQEAVATEEEIAQAQADGILGEWRLQRTEIFGKVIEAEATENNSMYFHEDGTVECIILGIKSTAVWTYDGEAVTVIENISDKEIKTVYSIKEGQLISNTKGIKKYYSKMQ